MTLDDVANLGEIFGAIAVLITLFYLAIQIRQSSAASRAQTRQALADSQIGYLNSRALDPFIRAVSMKMYLGGEMNEEEAYALRIHLTAHIRLFENYFTQYALGTLDEQDWLAMREVIRSQLQFGPYREAFLNRDREKNWNADFAAEVREIIGQIDESAA